MKYRLMDIENMSMVAKGKGLGEERHERLGLRRCKLL